MDLHCRETREITSDPKTLEESAFACGGEWPSDREALRLREAVARLPESQRRAILLREWLGLSYSEIAQEMGRSLACVEALIFRARRALTADLRGRLAGVLNLGWLLSGAKSHLSGGFAAKALALGATVGTITLAGPYVAGQTTGRAPAESAVSSVDVKVAGSSPFRSQRAAGGISTGVGGMNRRGQPKHPPPGIASRPQAGSAILVAPAGGSGRPANDPALPNSVREPKPQAEIAFRRSAEIAARPPASSSIPAAPADGSGRPADDPALPTSVKKPKPKVGSQLTDVASGVSGRPQARPQDTVEGLVTDTSGALKNTVSGVTELVSDTSETIQNVASTASGGDGLVTGTSGALENTVSGGTELVSDTSETIQDVPSTASGVTPVATEATQDLTTNLAGTADTVASQVPDTASTLTDSSTSPDQQSANPQPASSDSQGAVGNAVQTLLGD
jgi:hypothetical protein